MTYTARYRRWFFWRKVKNITGDTVLEVKEISGRIEKQKVGELTIDVEIPEKYTIKYKSVRVLYIENKKRLEIPMSCEIEFFSDRFDSIKEKAENEVGQKISIK